MLPRPAATSRSRAPSGYCIRGFYSLSHVALPFPVSDALYGAEPDPSENFGENLGTLAPRGERNVLIASLDSLMPASSNPFFPYMTDRIGEGIPAWQAATGHFNR